MVLPTPDFLAVVGASRERGIIIDKQRNLQAAMSAFAQRCRAQHFNLLTLRRVEQSVAELKTIVARSCLAVSASENRTPALMPQTQNARLIQVAKLPPLRQARTRRRHIVRERRSASAFSTGTVRRGGSHAHVGLTPGAGYRDRAIALGLPLVA